MEKKNVKLDGNWVTPSALARDLEVAPSTVSNWIIRNQIDYVVFAGVERRRHLVDRRTAPEKRSVGKPAKKR